MATVTSSRPLFESCRTSTTGIAVRRHPGSSFSIFSLSLVVTRPFPPGATPTPFSSNSEQNQLSPCHAEVSSAEQPKEE